MGDQRTARVLAIDGGGMRGIIPATILSEFEARAGKPIHQLFDLIAGTSTGGIVALALVRGGKDGRALNTASDLAAFYENEGPEVFVRKQFQGGMRMARLLQRANPSQFIEDALDAYLADMRLSDALTDVLIPAYEIIRREPFVFDSAAAREDPERDFECADVAQATAAAPSYFPPVRVRPANARSKQTFTLIDGGVWANNPALCALLAARRRWPQREIALLSLGTGSAKASYSYEQASAFRGAQWARPILSIVLDAVSDSVHDAVRQLLGYERYLRLDPKISPTDNELDRTDPRFLKRLQEKAMALVEERSVDIETFLPQFLNGASKTKPTGEG